MLGKGLNLGLWRVYLDYVVLGEIWKYSSICSLGFYIEDKVDL